MTNEVNDSPALPEPFQYIADGTANDDIPVYTAGQVRQAIAQALAARDSAAGEWVMVPREPTEDMKHAANEKCRTHRLATAADLYRAMLAAAPSPSQAVGEASRQGEAVATMLRGGTNTFGRANIITEWLPAAEDLPDGRHPLYAVPPAQEVADSHRLDWFEANPHSLSYGNGYLKSKSAWCYRDEAGVFQVSESLRHAIDEAGGRPATPSPQDSKADEWDGICGTCDGRGCPTCKPVQYPSKAPSGVQLVGYVGSHGEIIASTHYRGEPLKQGDAVYVFPSKAAAAPLGDEPPAQVPAGTSRFVYPDERPIHSGDDPSVPGLSWYDFGSSRQHPCVINARGRTPLRDGDWIVKIGTQYHAFTPEVWAFLAAPPAPQLQAEAGKVVEALRLARDVLGKARSFGTKKARDACPRALKALDAALASPQLAPQEKKQ